MRNRKEWYAPVPPEPLDLLDLLDREILKIGLLHGDAKRSNVALTRQTLASIRREFHTARKLSQLLTPVQRLLVCHILKSETTEHHLQDLLLNVLANEDGSK